MNEGKLTGEQGPDSSRKEIKAADIGGESMPAEKDEDYLLFANSSRSYFQFQMKDTDSSKQD